MTGSRKTLEASYARTLLPLARTWRQAADRALASMGLSASSGWALIQVGRLGDDVRQIDLAHELDISGASMVRLIDQMVGAGLVDRRADEADRRVSRVCLTKRGAALTSTIEATLGDMRHDLLAGLSDAELAGALAVALHVEATFTRMRSVA